MRAVLERPEDVLERLKEVLERLEAVLERLEEVLERLKEVLERLKAGLARRKGGPQRSKYVRETIRNPFRPPTTCFRLPPPHPAHYTPPAHKGAIVLLTPIRTLAVAAGAAAASGT